MEVHRIRACAGFEVGDKVTQGLEAALPQDMNPIGKSTLEGGASGLTGGAAYGLTAAGQSMATQAISQGVAAMNVLAPRTLSNRLHVGLTDVVRKGSTVYLRARDDVVRVRCRLA